MAVPTLHWENTLPSILRIEDSGTRYVVMRYNLKFIGVAGKNRRVLGDTLKNTQKTGHPKASHFY